MGVRPLCEVVDLPFQEDESGSRAIGLGHEQRAVRRAVEPHPKRAGLAFADLVRSAPGRNDERSKALGGGQDEVAVVSGRGPNRVIAQGVSTRKESPGAYTPPRTRSTMLLSPGFTVIGA